MKVVVQNGAPHTLSRRQVEAMAALMPAAWREHVDQIAICSGPQLTVAFHSKVRAFSLICSREGSVAEAVDALIAGLAVSAETGSVPKRFDPSTFVGKSGHLTRVRDECVRLLDEK